MPELLIEDIDNLDGATLEVLATLVLREFDQLSDGQQNDFADWCASQWSRLNSAVKAKFMDNIREDDVDWTKWETVLDVPLPGVYRKVKAEETEIEEAELRIIAKFEEAENVLLIDQQVNPKGSYNSYVFKRQTFPVDNLWDAKSKAFQFAQAASDAWKLLAATSIEAVKSEVKA
jgi:hypothetical protein